MSDISFSLDPTLLDQMNSIDFSSQSGGLPFQVRHFYALNGDARMANAGVPAMFFGGWATDKADWDAYLQASNLRQLNGLSEGVIAGRGSNQTVPIYSTRSLYIAPVASRSAWLVDQGKRRVPQYEAGARRHTQLLVILADKTAEGTLVIHGPAVLTAKGFQAVNLTRAVDDWQRHTATLRAQVAPGVPAWLFWLAIGTFGAERKVEMVGGNQKSPITPIGAYLPDPLTVDILHKAYGGEALAKMILDLRVKSADWVEAWSKSDETPAGREVNMSAPRPVSNDRDFPTVISEPVF